MGERENFVSLTFNAPCTLFYIQQELRDLYCPRIRHRDLQVNRAETGAHYWRYKCFWPVISARVYTSVEHDGGEVAIACPSAPPVLVPWGIAASNEQRVAFNCLPPFRRASLQALALTTCSPESGKIMRIYQLRSPTRKEKRQVRAVQTAQVFSCACNA